ncbi:MAG: ankyrin repeat domain-containing protein [Lentisphaeria bacterium]|nr:ankyrin repeat domain-containing protein [Lentisphaeria bacterium]
MDHQIRNIHLTAMLENNSTPEELAPALEIGNVHETPGMQNEEPIHGAAWHSSYTANIDLLMAHGADINARDEYQETPLFYAVKGKYPEIMIPHLLAKGADLEARNDYQQTPFLAALDYCDDPVPVITLLKNAGCDLSVTDEHGNGALEYAAMHGNDLKLFETLYEFGCVPKPEVPDENRHPNDDPM